MEAVKLDKWNSAKYKMAINSLRVQVDKQGLKYEADILDLSTDFIVNNWGLKRYLELQGYFDVVRKVANDIGYEGGECYNAE
jgi:hypothetical protein